MQPSNAAGSRRDRRARAPAEVVHTYLSTVRSADGAIQWPDVQRAPGDEWIKLHSVEILQEGVDGPTGDVNIAKAVRIRITYRSLKEGAQLYSGIWLKDHQGTFVLACHNSKSQNLTPDPWYGRTYPVGLFQAECTLPGNFLNEGRYYVTPLLGRVPNAALALEESVVGFDAHDTGAMREEYMGSWTGPVIRPRLAWTTVCLGSGRD